MPGRYRQLRMQDPDVFLLLPAAPLAHRHARILRTLHVDHTLFCFRYPDLHHGLLGVVYAPPGSSSSVTYGGSTLVGASHSMTAMFSSTNITSTSETTGFSLFGFGST